MCVCVCLRVEPVSRSKDYVRSRIKTGSVVCLFTPVSSCVPEIEGIYATGEHTAFENVPLVGCMYMYLLACQVELP